MSFQISPEALISSLRSQIPSLQQQIIDLENNIVEIPDIRFKTVEVINPQGFFSGQTTQVAIRRTATEIGLIRGNNILGDEIKVLKNRISSINSQITLLEKDIEIKQIKSIDLQEIENIPVIQPKQNNTLRNAILIGGAILLL